MRNKITKEEVMSHLNYDRVTGEFHWKVSGRGRRGDLLAGTVSDNGYIVISINKKPYRAHVLAIVYVTGCMPEFDVDHINGVRTDNSFKNLRTVTRSENLKNSSIRRDNKSGFTGVSWCKNKGRWCARITIEGKYKNLGYFALMSDAIDARINANKEFGYHSGHGKDTRI